MHATFPSLQTSRLLLRQFLAADTGMVYKGLSHPEVIKYYGVWYDSLEATSAQMRFFEDLEKNGTGIWWAVCSADNTVFYGACGLNSLHREHKKAEIGFWLLPEFWGKGIIPEVVPLVCEYGFKYLGLHRIESIIESENQNSKRVMAKLGFSYEGTMRECEIKHGKYISLDIFAKLNPEG